MLTVYSDRKQMPAASSPKLSASEQQVDPEWGHLPEAETPSNPKPSVTGSGRAIGYGTPSPL
jgi:hypothetical protein